MTWLLFPYTGAPAFNVWTTGPLHALTLTFQPFCSWPAKLILMHSALLTNMSLCTKSWCKIIFCPYFFSKKMNINCSIMPMRGFEIYCRKVLQWVSQDCMTQHCFQGTQHVTSPCKAGNAETKAFSLIPICKKTSVARETKLSFLLNLLPTYMSHPHLPQPEWNIMKEENCSSFIKMSQVMNFLGKYNSQEDRSRQISL